LKIGYNLINDIKGKGGSSVKKAMLIVNPSSGKEMGREFTAHALDTMKKMGYETDVCLTKGEGDAMEFARESCNNKFDFLVAMGGTVRLMKRLTEWPSRSTAHYLVSSPSERSMILLERSIFL
jgi:Diacylglycerol kinase catalytic domain